MATMLKLVVVLVACFASAWSFQLTSSSQVASRAIRMATEAPPTTDATPEATPEVEFVGAKKFSMKDRYTKTVMNSEDIAKILPHRYPFLLVDRVVEMEPGKRAVGIKCVTANEPQFTGHFPDRPIMPGVMMIEAMAQLGGLICLQPPVTPAREEGQPQRIFFFTGVNGVRWKSPVTPGDDLVMEMNLLNFDDRLGFATLTGKAYVGGKVAVTVEEFTFALARD